MSAGPITLTTVEARRLAVRAQLLSGPRPSADARGIMHVVRRLGRLQIDATNAVARSHLLVLWSRLGPYDITHLERLRWKEHRLFEYRAYILPTEDFPVYHWRMRRFPVGDSAWPRRVRLFLEHNAPLRRHILVRLRRHGPLPSRAFEDIANVGWRSGGWTSGRNVGQMLEFLAAQGRVLVSGREGGERLWDLADRALPEWMPRDRLSDREVARRFVESALRAHNLIHDRVRTAQLFDFDFRLEIYTPKAKRRYGYFVMPILHGDRLIGRVDPLMDREHGQLRINAVYAEPDAPGGRAVGQAVAVAIEELATFLGAGEIAYDGAAPTAWRMNRRARRVKRPAGVA